MIKQNTNATRVSNEELWTRMQDMHDELRAEISGLKRQLADADDEVAKLRAQRANEQLLSSDDSEGVQSRRSLLKKAGIGAAVTAAGVASMSKPAAALDGDPINAGETTTAQSPTVVVAPGASNINGVTVEDQAMFGSSATYGSSLAAYSSSLTTGNAFFAYKERRNDVLDDGYAGVFWAAGGSRANLRLRTFGLADPRTDSYAHFAGAIRYSDGDFWVCVESGTPGTWRKIAGPATAGVLHPITPKRVWDTRFQDGAMSNDESRTISIKDGRVLSSDAVDVPDLVPAGATAITFNLTCVSTSPGGFLAITPGDATDFTAASVNWAEQGAVLNNGTLSPVDGSRQVKVWCSGTTHFIIDVTGYYA